MGECLAVPHLYTKTLTKNFITNFISNYMPVLEQLLQKVEPGQELKCCCLDWKVLTKDVEGEEKMGK